MRNRQQSSDQFGSGSCGSASAADIDIAAAAVAAVDKDVAGTGTGTGSVVAGVHLHCEESHWREQRVWRDNADGESLPEAVTADRGDDACWTTGCCESEASLPKMTEKKSGKSGVEDG